jgi:excisionase family DNA binding protein
MITVLNCKQAAARLHFSVPEVKDLALSGGLPAIFYGGKVRFVEREIEAWLGEYTGDGGNSALQEDGR